MLHGRVDLKRNRVGFLTLSLAVGLLACGGSASPSSSAPPPTTTTTTGAAATYQPINPAPVSAVEAFLTAEIAGDFEASFSLLSDDDQRAAGDQAGWVADHYLVLPTIQGFQLTADSADGTRAEVMADLSLEAGLDQVIGLTPGNADSNWVLSKDAGEWKISFAQSRIEPVYLEDADAHEAVEQWAVRRQRCEPATESDASLLGFPSLAEGLCGSVGPLRAGPVMPLVDAAESAPFLAAFGPEVGRWARVVAIEGAHPLRAVIAPIGHEWVVIGVLDA